MQEINFYCKKCKCSMHMSYIPVGKPETPVMNGIVMKCTRCKKASTFKNFKEGRITASVDKDNKFYL